MNQQNLLRLENKFSKQLKAILGGCFFTKNIDDDLTKGIDFAVYTIKPFKVACRLRGFGYQKRYGNQFTVRWELKSGNRTEIDKIKDGFVDYMLYGFIDADEIRIIQWVLVDLKPIREGLEPFEIRQNKMPDENKLAAYSLVTYPKEYILDFWQE